ncbi:Nn.00g089630.m01.CDS01 [Neocucurbitaria sp. VM-36]
MPDMSDQEMHKRPTRARTAVGTYNLKVLTENVHNSHLNERESRSSMALNGRSDSMSRAATPVTKLHVHRRNISSGLTSPMPSPNLSALGSGLTDNTTTAPRKLEAIDPDITSNDTRIISTAVASSVPMFDCFNTQPHSWGHFYSANELFSRGIWIGYLTPDRHSESFRRLPSFSDLKTNFRKFSTPYPPTITGSVGEERISVCRGCVGDDSAVITLREIQFFQKQKLVIMPLDGDDEVGMFCIMLPQPNDRSLRGLQSYRPYELLNGGKGDIFDNKFMLLSLRNTSRDIGTLETVREVLRIVEPESVECRTTKRQRRYSSSDLATRDPLSMAMRSPPITTADRLVVEDEDEDIPDIAFTQGRNSLSSKSSSKQILPDHKDKLAPQNMHDRTHISVSHSSERDLIHPTNPETNPKAPAATRPTQLVPLDLTDEQPRLVYIVWTVNDDEVDYDFVHTLNECHSFKCLLDLLQEDTEAIPAIRTMLAETQVWRMTYQLSGGKKKAVITRPGSEIAFERLKVTLAQCPVWTGNPSNNIEIELTSLCRPLGSATAT